MTGGVSPGARRGAGVRTVLMTAPDEGVGLEIARRLVDEGLAACGSVLPGVTSVYRWKGRVEEAGEVLVVLKTLSGRVGQLIERAVELHPYDVPELLSLSVEEGHGPYLDWVVEETREGPDG